jgi:hypothetical protein
MRTPYEASQSVAPSPRPIIDLWESVGVVRKCDRTRNGQKPPTVESAQVHCYLLLAGEDPTGEQ